MVLPFQFDQSPVFVAPVSVVLVGKACGFVNECCQIFSVQTCGEFCESGIACGSAGMGSFHWLMHMGFGQSVSFYAFHKNNHSVVSLSLIHI